MSLTIMVTAASAGFGTAMSRRFIRDGHRVIGCARRGDKLAGLPAGGAAGEIARVAVFLAPDDASYINGAILAADGGWSAL